LVTNSPCLEYFSPDLRRPCPVVVVIGGQIGGEAYAYVATDGDEYGDDEATKSLFTLH
jgi:hypothetical protein